MRKARLSSLLVFIGLGTVALGQRYIEEDDLYYQPGEKNPIVEQK